MSGFFESKVNLVNTLFKNVSWYITQKICEQDALENPWMIVFVPDQYKTQEMCEKAVEEDPYSLQLVPDWFVMQDQVKIWYDDDDYCNDDELITWYDAYKKRRAQKVEIKEDLMPIA